jgi:hypothetical protein
LDVSIPAPYVCGANFSGNPETCQAETTKRPRYAEGILHEKAFCLVARLRMARTEIEQLVLSRQRFENGAGSVFTYTCLAYLPSLLKHSNDLPDG